MGTSNITNVSAGHRPIRAGLRSQKPREFPRLATLARQSGPDGKYILYYDKRETSQDKVCPSLDRDLGHFQMFSNWT